MGKKNPRKITSKDGYTSMDYSRDTKAYAFFGKIILWIIVFAVILYILMALVGNPISAISWILGIDSTTLLFGIGLFALFATFLVYNMTRRKPSFGSRRR